MKPWMWLALAAGGYYLYTKSQAAVMPVTPPPAPEEGAYEGEPTTNVVEGVFDAVGEGIEAVSDWISQ